MLRSSVEAPLLAVPLLAGGDGVDDTAVAFLLSVALQTKQEEEKEKVMEELDVLMRTPWSQLTPDQRAVLSQPGASQAWSAGRRKHLKKRRRTTSGVLTATCGTQLVMDCGCWWAYGQRLRV